MWERDHTVIKLSSTKKPQTKYYALINLRISVCEVEQRHIELRVENHFRILTYFRQIRGGFLKKITMPDFRHHFSFSKNSLLMN